MVEMEEVRPNNTTNTASTKILSIGNSTLSSFNISLHITDSENETSNAKKLGTKRLYNINDSLPIEETPEKPLYTQRIIRRVKTQPSQNTKPVQPIINNRQEQIKSIYSSNEKKKLGTKRLYNINDTIPIENSPENPIQKQIVIRKVKTQPPQNSKRIQRGINNSQVPIKPTCVPGKPIYMPRIISKVKTQPTESSRRIQPIINNPQELIKPLCSRRSSFEFEGTVNLIKTQTQTNKKYFIVCTRFHQNELIRLKQVVKRLGKFDIQNEVVNNTTHLIVGEATRTLNLLRGIIRGIWILRIDWLYRSEEENKWLHEEDYEFTELSPAIIYSRIQRQCFGGKYSMDVFSNCENIFIENGTRPSYKHLSKLIKSAGGKVTQSIDEASIIICPKNFPIIQKNNKMYVSEAWILDSIMYNRLMKLKEFRIS